MKSSTKKKLACGLLLAVGLGLVIGGAFFPPLLTAGVPILSTALGIFTHLMKKQEAATQESTPPANPPQDEEMFTRFKHFVVRENAKILTAVSKLIVQATLHKEPKQDKPQHQHLQDTKPVLFRHISPKAITKRMVSPMSSKQRAKNE